MCSRMAKRVDSENHNEITKECEGCETPNLPIYLLDGLCPECRND